VSDKFIYKNSRGQFDLSYAGTKWAVREMAKEGEAIRIKDHPKMERCVMDPEWLTVTVLAERVLVDRESSRQVILDSTIGSSRVWIKQKLNDGRIIPDEFFFSKGVSKATRNAQQSLMDQDFKKKMIDLLVKKQTGQLPPSAAKPAKKAAPAAPAPGPTSVGGSVGPAPSSAGVGGAAPAPQKPSGQPAAAPAAAGPAKSPPAKPQAAPAKPAAPAAPPAAAKPAVPNTTKPAPSQAPREAALDVMCQRFLIVLKQASGAGQDLPKALAFLKALTGKEAVNKLSKEEITELGPILHGLTKGASRHEGGIIYDAVTGEQLYPRTEAQYEPAPEPQVEAPADPVPVSGDGAPEPSEPMF
jgi:hypothetical protein